LGEEKTFQDAHSILHYINKEDPRGETPPNHTDEQYQLWEDAINTWSEENNITRQAPPTEFDDIHTLGNRPTISIIQPANNQTITDRNLQATVSAAAPRGISRVAYYLNNQLIQIHYSILV